MNDKHRERRSEMYRYSRYLSFSATKAEHRFKELLDKLEIPYRFQKGFLTRDPKTGAERFRIVDFYIPKLSTGIEIDGGYHFTKETITLDEYRTLELQNAKRKLILLRFTNDEVLSECLNVRMSLKWMKRQLKGKKKGRNQKSSRLRSRIYFPFSTKKAQKTDSSVPIPERELLPPVEFFTNKKYDHNNHGYDSN